MYHKNLLTLLQKRASLASLKQIHAHSLTLGLLLQHQSLSCKLLDTYANLGEQEAAEKVFNRIQDPDIVSWACFLNLYLRIGLPTESLSVFSRFLSCGFRPDGFLAVGALSACGRLRDCIRGRVIHGMVLRLELDVNPIVGNALIDMYSRNGHIAMAVLVFENMRAKDVSSWNSLLNGFLMGNDLISARQVFDKMLERDSISWNAMISGYVRGGTPIQALEQFQTMMKEGTHPTIVTIVVVLSGCADIGAFDFGQSMHAHITKNNMKLDVTVSNALMDMYSKSGSLDLAIKLFNEMWKRDVFSWTTILSAYAVHGRGDLALEVYYDMLACGVTPNAVTFLSVLTACSHAGLVVEGKTLFNRIIRYSGGTDELKVEHYGCMVDLLGRAGLLEEANELIEQMPMNPDGAIWRSLLASCLVHKNLNLAEIARKKLMEMEPDDDGVCVLLWNIFCAANRWEDASKIRKLMRDLKIKKRRGCSWIEVNGVIKEFSAEDLTHHIPSEIIPLITRDI